MAFATPEQLAGHLQVDLDRYTAEQALDRATARIQALTGQQFEAVAGDVHTATVRGDDLLLPQRPVTAVTTVAYRYLTTLTEQILTEDVDWHLDGSRIAWLGTRDWPARITVTYDHGYATIPQDVVDACLEIATELYANPERLTTEAVDDYRAQRDPGAVGPALGAVIRRYRARPLSARIAR